MYLVTGGAGFIGSHIVDRLVANGERVRIIDNFSTGNKESLSKVINHDYLELVEGDISDYATVEDAVKGIKGIFHHAGFVSVEKSILEPKTSFTNNVLGVFNIFEAARNNGVRRIVHASSAAIYGDKRTLPIHENDSFQPISPYALDKIYAEQLANIYYSRYGIESAALRYFNVYGPRQNIKSDYSGVISNFVAQALDGGDAVIYGDGEQTRDFIYVDDVVNANILAMNAEISGAACYNIGSGESTSIKELFRLVCNIIGCKLGIRYEDKRQGEIRHSFASISNALNHLGWKPQIKLEKGLSEFIDQS